MLRAYLESKLAFMGGYRNHPVAIVVVALNVRDTDASRLLDAGTKASQQLLARFQADGELQTDFDPAVIDVAIPAAVDAVPPWLAHDPGFDVGHYGRDMADLFDRVTRERTRSGGPSGDE